MTRHVLADRLKALWAQGVLDKVPYQTRPVRYEYRLTEKGRALHPVLMSLVHWGDEYMTGDEGRPLLHTHLACGCDFDPVMTCSVCGEAVGARQVQVRPGPGA